MRNLPNIEPSAFRRGEYVGYAAGVWRITAAVKRGHTVRSWRAVHRDDPAAPIYRAPTLTALSLLLEAHAADIKAQHKAAYDAATKG